MSRISTTAPYSGIGSGSATSARPGLGFWLKWVLFCTAFGHFNVLVISFSGGIGAFVCALGGLIVGSLQAFALRTYLGREIAIQWVFTTAVGWLGAVGIVFFGEFFVGLGSGLNNFDPRGDEIGVAIIAGAFFGVVQGLFVPKLGLFAWTAINALAWGLGTYIGGTVAFAFDSTRGYMYFLLNTAMGAVVGIITYGIITGLGVIGLLRYRTYLAQSMESKYQASVKLYIICGLPFSGKTTLANELARRLGFTRIAMDEINTERGLGLNGTQIAPQQWNETYSEMYWRVRVA